MLDSLAFSVSGLSSAAEVTDVWASDIANVATPGFQSELPLAQSGSLTRVGPIATGTTPTDAAGAGLIVTQRQTAAGPAVATGSPLDAYLPPGTYLRVERSSGQSAFTRDAALMIDARGALVTASGERVLGTSGRPLRLPAGAHGTRIRTDGTVVTTVAGRTVQVGVLSLVAFDNPSGLMATDHNLLTASANSGPPVAVRRPALLVGYEVGSNVDVAQALTGVIIAARAFQGNLAVMHEASGMLRQMDQLTF